MLKNSRQLQKENTREKILLAAYEEFGRRGILTARMADIAEAAGVSHGAVFLHFKTQEALISEVIGAYGERIARRTHELAAGGSTVREVLAAHLIGIVEFEPFYTRLVLEQRALPEDCRSAWIGIQSALSFHLSQAAGREMDAGYVKRMPVHFLFNAWAGLVHHYLANGDLFAPGGSVIGRYGEELLDQYMKLISINNKEEYP